MAADTNRYTPTGQLKPANQLYYFDVSPDHRPTSSAVSQGRVTVSYERAHRDLIRLRLAGLGEMSGSKSRSEILQQYWLKGPSLTSGGLFNATPENGANQAFQRFYFPNLARSDQPHRSG